VWSRGGGQAVSDTPRTDAKRGFHDLDTAVDAEFSEQLERELNVANDRIKRLEDAGDVLMNCIPTELFCKQKLQRIENQWHKAKEAKP
jgi:hypothetical protein